MEPRLVYEMMAADPEPIGVLFRKCFDAFCALKDYMDEVFAGGKRSGHLGLADDNSAFVSDAMYRAQVLPWNRRLYERYGFNGRYLHADGPNEHHFRTYVEDIKLNSMDIGGWSRLEPAVEILKGKCVFSGNMNCRDFYGAFDEELRRKIRHRIRLAAPGGGYIFAIGGETYPRVDPDTLVRGFDYVREIGRYPIGLPPED
jgi:uroporphyrinogen-III decarboxylase